MKKILLLFSLLLATIFTNAQCNCNILGDNFFTGDYNITQAVSGPFGFAFSSDGSVTTVTLSATSDNERSFNAEYLPDFSNTIRNYTITLDNCEATFINQDTGLSCVNGLILGPETGGSYSNIDDTSFTVVYQEDSTGDCGSPESSIVTLTFTKVSGVPSLINIPDPNFELALINLSIDTNLDGVIEASNAVSVTNLDVSSSNIQNLTGIEAFINLDVLNVDNNNLSSLDLSKNCTLISLQIGNNQLTSVNLRNGNNTSIISFGALNNPSLECIQVDDVTYMNTNFSTSIDSQTSFSSNCSEDFDALVALYNSTNGANWTNAWDLNASINTFYGVTLDANDRVTSIDLSGNNLTGTLPTELGSLTNIQALNLRNNQLTGSIPENIGNLSNLQTILSLGGNQLTGTIPIELGNLVNLERLELDNNQLSGTIIYLICNFCS